MYKYKIHRATDTQILDVSVQKQKSPALGESTTLPFSYYLIPFGYFQVREEEDR